MFLAKERCPACFAQWGSSIYCPACGGLAEIFFERDLPKQDQVDGERLQSMIQVARTRVYSHPNDGNARYMLGLDYVFLGLIEEGIAELDIAADILAGVIQIRYESAALSAKLGRFDDKILEKIKGVIEIKPEYKEAHFLEGVIHENRGEITAAVKSWQNAYKIDPLYQPAETKLLDFIIEERETLSPTFVKSGDDGLSLSDTIMEHLRLVCSPEPEEPPPLGGTSMALLSRFLPGAADEMRQKHRLVISEYMQDLALRENAWQHLESDLVTLSNICLANRIGRLKGAPLASAVQPE